MSKVDFPEFDPNLSQNDLLKNYENAIDNKVDVDSPDHGEIWEKFSQAVCGCVWKILFSSKTPSKDQMDKSSALLKKYREDALFITPTFYNNWIYKFRDELLKKELLEFWKNEVVAKELGPIWAKDSDFFDKSDDPEPANFYKHAGCEAPWLKGEKKKPIAPHLNLMSNTAANVASNASTTSSSPKSLKKISLENAMGDYKHNMEAQKDIDPDDEDAYKKIFTEVRDIIWQLLFAETLTADRSKNAANLLQEYKLDACFYSPYDYNDWICKVKDELCKRKYKEFWQIIVNEKLGLCWAKDSDYFDDMDDPKPMEFYKSGDELMKQK